MLTPENRTGRAAGFAESRLNAGHREEQRGCRERNEERHPARAVAVGLAQHARELAHQYIAGYYLSVLEHYEFANAGLAEIPGYEYYGKLAERIAKHGAEDFSRFLAGLQISGNPASVTEQIRENIRRIDGAGVVGIFNYAGMPDDVTNANVELFADKVMPTLQTIDTGVQVGRPVIAATR